MSWLIDITPKNLTSVSVRRESRMDGASFVTVILLQGAEIHSKPFLLHDLNQILIYCSHPWINFKNISNVGLLFLTSFPFPLTVASLLLFTKRLTPGALCALQHHCDLMSRKTKSNTFSTLIVKIVWQIFE